MVLTLTLITIGIVDVVSSFATFSDLPGTLRTLYLAQRIGEYTNTQLALSVGAVVNASRIVLLVVAIWLSSSRLRTGKLAWPVPVIAGAVSVLVASVSLIVAILGDPGLAAYVALLPTT